MNAQVYSIVLVVVGGAIGFTSSLGVWYLNVRQQRRAARKQMMLRVITLAYTLVLYVRNLLYAKAAGIQAVRELGEGPFPEIAAIASFTFSEVGPVVVLINEDLAALSARDTTGADAGPWMIQQAEKLVTHCNELVALVNECATREGLEKWSTPEEARAAEDLLKAARNRRAKVDRGAT